jgi:hypothetical protein
MQARAAHGTVPMNSAATIPCPKLGARRAIVWAGLTCGIMDITAAAVVNGLLGVSPIRMLQGIASGLLGPRSFAGGLATAFLGLLCHFAIAFSAAGVFFAVSRRMRFLVQHAVLSGALYGVVVYFFMNRIVVPLSGARRHPFSFRLMVIGLVVHILCVGLPISLMVRRYSVR